MWWAMTSQPPSSLHFLLWFSHACYRARRHIRWWPKTKEGSLMREWQARGGIPDSLWAWALWCAFGFGTLKPQCFRKSLTTSFPPRGFESVPASLPGLFSSLSISDGMQWCSSIGVLFSCPGPRPIPAEAGGGLRLQIPLPFPGGWTQCGISFLVHQSEEGGTQYWPPWPPTVAWDVLPPHASPSLCQDAHFRQWFYYSWVSTSLDGAPIIGLCFGSPSKFLCWGLPVCKAAFLFPSSSFLGLALICQLGTHLLAGQCLFFFMIKSPESSVMPGT